MNLTDEKKVPLRSMPVQQKKMMLENFLQTKHTSKVDFYFKHFVLQLCYSDTNHTILQKVVTSSSKVHATCDINIAHLFVFLSVILVLYQNDEMCQFPPPPGEGSPIILVMCNLIIL